MTERRSEPRPAAAVILARQGPDDLELFMVRRPSAAAAFADVWVFPGGSIRPDDERPLEGFDALAEMTRRGGVPPASAAEAAALWRCALRELYEEAGVLLARDSPCPPDRKAVHDGSASLDGIVFDPGALIYFSHWITPHGLPRRFDTRFFVAVLPPGQTASHCGLETTDGRWIAPRASLGLYAAGSLPLVLPTRMHLQRLTPVRTVDDLLRLAAEKPVRTVLPGRPSDGADPRIWTQDGEERGW